MANENPQDQSELKKKGGRKRKFPDQNESIRKELYNTNQAYFRKNGFQVEPKIFKFITKCCFRECHKNLNEIKQNQNFQVFYGLGSFEARSSYINSCVGEVEPTRRTTKYENEPSRRGFTKIYSLSNERVCKTFFCELLQISSKRVDTALKKSRDELPRNLQFAAGDIFHLKSLEKLQKAEIDKVREIGQQSVLKGDEHRVDDLQDQEVVYEEHDLIEEEYLEEDTISSDEPEIIDITQDDKPREFDQTFACSCPNNCTDKLPLKTRRQLFQMFWNIGTNLDRNAFVNCCVNELEKPKINSDGAFLRKFFLKGVEICEPTFSNTLMVSSAQIDSSLQGMADSEDEVDPKEKIVAHIVENFSIEPLLEILWASYKTENPDDQVTEHDYKDTFHDSFLLQLIERDPKPPDMSI